MAPAIVLFWAWSRCRGMSGALPRAGRLAVLAIVVSYVVQGLGLVVGVVAASRFAEPLDHLADFTGLVGVIVVAEYVGHAAAAVLAVKVLASSRPKPRPISRRIRRWIPAFAGMTVAKV